MAKILLVSADGEVEDALRRLLQSRGHDLTARSTFAAINRAGAGGEWDAAFLDLSVDGDAGLSVVAQAQGRAPTMRITVLDEGGDSPGLDRLASAIALGAEEFVRKPIDRLDADAVLDRLGL
jgi:DNA-binding NtrC family response regulator